jgi:hypothetical protein
MRKEGLWTYYSIKSVTQQYHTDLIRAVRIALVDETVLKADLKRLKRARQLKPPCR